MKNTHEHRAHCFEHLNGVVSHLGSNQKTGSIKHLKRKIWKTLPRGCRKGQA